MGILKNLTFDAVSLSDYGVGLTGSGVYDAPERDVDMIEIPGRNGEYALDKGRYNNIEVTYPAGAYDASQPDFASKISDLRNALASLKGYKRLEDEYNPDEYRLGIFKSGLKVDPVHYSRAGEFDLVFNCKPQRYLKSGETEQTVTSGGTITNPTLFESAPLLLVDGYGAIDIDGQALEVSGLPLGKIKLVNAGTVTGSVYSYLNFAPSAGKLNAGDVLTLEPTKAISNIFTSGGAAAGYNNLKITEIIITDDTQGYTEAEISADGASAIVVTSYPLITFEYGTPNVISASYGWNVRYSYDGGSSNRSGTCATTIRYDGANQIRIYCSNEAHGNPSYGFSNVLEIVSGALYGDSTVYANIGVYIDLEIGEAYQIKNDELVSVNNAVILPADLPTLKPGANVITYDNTITSLKITPRWWKL